MRTLAVAAAICLASWFGLLVGAGNVGLQRSVAIGPATLFDVPMALLLAFGLALVVTVAGSRLARSSGASRTSLVAAVLLCDVVGAAVIAPLAVGELELVHAPTVLVAITALGLQPIGAFIGATLAQRAYDPERERLHR
jgi:hypothetical protein